jgi:hypothetical protein
LHDTLIILVSTQAMERKAAWRQPRSDRVVIAILLAVLKKITKKLLNMISKLPKFQNVTNKS